MVKRRLVMGDIHGAHKAMVQVLDRCNYDPASDVIWFVGDAVDGWPDTPKCIDLLIELKSRNVLGNHDKWCLEWASGVPPDKNWWVQGGAATVRAYHPEVVGYWDCVQIRGDRLPEKHYALLNEAPMYIEDGDICYTHGGLVPYKRAEVRPSHGWEWDRYMWEKAVYDDIGHNITPYKKVFIGHSPTINYGSDKPMHVAGVWNVDTGAAWSGKLTIMDVDTEEYWQSEIVRDLYPDFKGRGQ